MVTERLSLWLPFEATPIGVQSKQHTHTHHKHTHPPTHTHISLQAGKPRTRISVLASPCCWRNKSRPSPLLPPIAPCFLYLFWLSKPPTPKSAGTPKLVDWIGSLPSQRSPNHEFGVRCSTGPYVATMLTGPTPGSSSGYYVLLVPGPSNYP